MSGTAINEKSDRKELHEQKRQKYNTDPRGVTDHLGETRGIVRNGRRGDRRVTSEGLRFLETSARRIGDERYVSSDSEEMNYGDR